MDDFNELVDDKVGRLGVAMMVMGPIAMFLAINAMDFVLFGSSFVLLTLGTAYALYAGYRRQMPF